jgi:glutathione S-transferase
MPTLYVKTGCPYCAKVLMTADILGVALEKKNVADPGVAEELVLKGGKKQEPYLVDADRGVSMYEADAIIAYLNKQYGGGNAAGPQASPAAPMACPID